MAKARKYFKSFGVVSLIGGTGIGLVIPQTSRFGYYLIGLAMVVGLFVYQSELRLFLTVLRIKSRDAILLTKLTLKNRKIARFGYSDTASRFRLARPNDEIVRVQQMEKRLNNHINEADGH